MLICFSLSFFDRAFALLFLHPWRIFALFFWNLCCFLSFQWNQQTTKLPILSYSLSLCLSRSQKCTRTIVSLITHVNFFFLLFLCFFFPFPFIRVCCGAFFHNFVRSLPRDAYASNQTQTNSDVTNVVWTATSIGNKAEFAEKEGCRRVGGWNDCRSKFRADTSRDINETLCHTKVVRTWPALNGHTLIYRATKLASPIGSKQMFMVIGLCHFGSVKHLYEGPKWLESILNQSSFIIWNGCFK